MNYNDYYARQAGLGTGQSVRRSVAQRHAAHQEKCRGFG